MSPKIKTTLFAIIFANSQALYAGSMGPEPMPISYEGFYIGADIGVADLIVNESTTVPPASHNLGSTGIVGGGLVGYDYSLNAQYKLGIEGFMNANGMNVSAQQDYGSHPSFRANARYNIGVRILPGYEFSPGTIGHILIGYSSGNFNIHDNGDYGYISRTFNKNGIQAGLGLKTAITPHLYIRGDAIYSGYASQTSYGISSTLPPVLQTYNNHFSTLEGDLTLVYKFS